MKATGIEICTCTQVYKSAVEEEGQFEQVKQGSQTVNQRICLVCGGMIFEPLPFMD